MIEKTFVHLPGVGLKTERALWDSGIQSWDSFCDPASPLPFGKRRSRALCAGLDESRENLCRKNADYFAGNLGSSLLWRLFPEFRDCTAYLDIETTGLGGQWDHITTASLYDGRTVNYYVHSKNLVALPDDLLKFKLLVTYNGSCFDLPFISSYFGIHLDHVHIDLRFLLRSLGYRGGLKACEKNLGLCRNELNGVDGYFAVILWREYVSTGDASALETLLSYNIADTVNLESLMAIAYNLKIGATPFSSLTLPAPQTPFVPFRANAGLIQDLRERYCTPF